MTIKAKHESKCSKCGGQIKRGELIEWTRGSKPYHTKCPDQPEAVKSSYGKSWAANGRQAGHSCGKCGCEIKPDQKVHYRYPDKVLEHVNCEKAEATAKAEKTEAPYELHGGSGYGCRGWFEGQTLRTSERHQKDGWPEFVTVVSASERYIKEDGLSFGVGDEEGHVYYARCRKATAEEAAPVIKRIKKRERTEAAIKELHEIAKHIKDNGERPDGSHRPEGERLFDSQTIYGGGSWFVVNEYTAWYVRNNGGDGDMWAYNNVETGGAGAIGWRLDDESIVVRLKELSTELADQKVQVIA